MDFLYTVLYTLNNLKLEKFSKLLQKFYTELEDTQPEYFDSRQIARLKVICINYFLLTENVSIIKSSSIPNKSSILSNHIENDSRAILEKMMSEYNIDRSVINETTSKVIDSLVKIKSSELENFSSKEEVIEKLMIIKQQIANGKLDMKDNFYYNISFKIKEALEILYLYLENENNIKKYKTNYLSKSQKSVVENNAKKSLMKLVNNKGIDENFYNNLATYLIVRMNDKQ